MSWFAWMSVLGGLAIAYMMQARSEEAEKNREESRRQFDILQTAKRDAELEAKNARYDAWKKKVLAGRSVNEFMDDMGKKSGKYNNYGDLSADERELYSISEHS